MRSVLIFSLLINLNTRSMCRRSCCSLISKRKKNDWNAAAIHAREVIPLRSGDYRGRNKVEIGSDTFEKDKIAVSVNIPIGGVQYLSHFRPCMHATWSSKGTRSHVGHRQKTALYFDDQNKNDGHQPAHNNQQLLMEIHIWCFLFGSSNSKQNPCKLNY